MDIEELTIREVQSAYATGTFTAAELVRVYLGRIDSLDASGPKLNSIVSVADDALSVAIRLDGQLRSKGALTGPLHGIPVVVKDQIETAHLRTTYGTQAAIANVPRRDATVVARLRAAGAIILAKTTMSDFGASWFSASSVSGVTRNPYALDRDAGGSSSGTAAAVAANLAMVGVGGDTGGSIRVPASFCNLVGLRATPGVISRRGIAPLVAPQDTAGPMARTVADTALVFDVLAGTDPAGSDSPAAAGSRAAGNAPRNGEGDSPQGLRLGVLRDLINTSNHPSAQQVTDVFSGALHTLEHAGVLLIDVHVPGIQRMLADTSLYLSRSRADLDRFIASRPGIAAESVADLHARGLSHPSLDLLQAIVSSTGDYRHDPDYAARLRARKQLRRLTTGLMRKHRLHALVFPDVQVPPPLLHDVLTQRWSTFDFPTNTVLASQAGLAAMSLPIGFTTEALPVGMEIVTLPFAERELLRLGATLERVVGSRRPPSLRHGQQSVTLAGTR